MHNDSVPRGMDHKRVPWQGKYGMMQWKNSLEFCQTQRFEGYAQINSKCYR